MLTVAILLLAGSFVLSAILTGAVRRVSLRAGFVDRPAAHKQHGREVPLGGGLAILATVAMVLLGSAAVMALLGRWQPAWVPAAVYENLAGLGRRMPAALLLGAGAAALGLMGLVDDRRPLRPAAKFLVQLLVAVGTVEGLGLRAAEFLGPLASLVLTVLWIVTITNAVNFLDNMDGLAGGVVVLCGLITAAAGAVNGQLFVPGMLLVVIGATGGFLLFNFPPARIFMGDAGSQPLGYLLGVLTVLTTYTRDFSHRPAAVLMPLVILAIPLYDLVSVIVLRRLAGRSVMVGDRRHFSHRLLARGMSPRTALLTVYLATCATALAAVFLMRLPLPFTWLVFAQTLCVLGIIALLEFGRGGRQAT